MKSYYASFIPKTNFLKIFFAAAIVFIFGISSSMATHLAGGNVTYRSLGGNQYQITVTIYRDCQGIAAPTSVTVGLVSSCGDNLSVTANPIPGTGKVVNPPCPGQFTKCDGLQYPTPGIQKWEYTVTVTLPRKCTDWRFWFALSARNNAITTIINPGADNLYIDAHLNNLTDTITSVRFSNDPILFVCLNQQFCFNNGAVAPKGDSLVYSFITPRTDVNTYVQYVAGFDSIHPITSVPAMSINPSTGDVCMTPTKIEVGVMAILVKQYRNGVLVGTVIRDIQIYTQVCNNALPTLSGINGTTNFSIDVCGGSTICFDIFSNDANATQNLTISANNTFGTFTSSGGQHPTGHFCWTTTANDIGSSKSFQVVVKDDNCPTNGTNTQTYTINVVGLQAVASTTPVSCNAGRNGTASVTASNGSGTYYYNWSPSQQTSQKAVGLLAGTYTVLVTDANGCTISRSVVIAQPPALTASINNLIPPTCANPGSFVIAVNGGTPIYTYLTNTTPNQTTPNVTLTSAGTYLSTVRDANGCRTSASVTVTVASAVTINVSAGTIACNGGTTKVTVTATGGIAPFSGTGTFTVPAGTYSYTVTDANGCTGSSSITISQPSKLVASALAGGVISCYGGTVTVTISASGGIPPFSGTGIFTVKAGTYNYTVTDGNGCIASTLINIQEPAELIATASNNTPFCIGGTIQFNSYSVGGTGQVQYSWNGPSFNSNLQNPVIVNSTPANSGTYTLMVTDKNGCQAFATTSVKVNPNPVVIITPNSVTITPGDSAKICASGAAIYIWSTGETSACIYVNSAGTYSVMGTDLNGCSSSASATVTLQANCTCNLSYPDSSNLPRSLVVFNESSVLAASDPGPASCIANNLIKVWYTDEHALTLGVRQVVVKSSTGTSTTNYAITPTPVTPTCVYKPIVGDTISSGDQSGNDVADGGGRPLWPALFITDLTVNGPNSRAGDWQQGGVGVPPIKVCGTWKGAVRTVDKTKNPAVVTVTPDVDPVKNIWAGVPDAPPNGFSSIKNEGYGAECVWDVDSLGLIKGHSYRLQFMVHDGDQNKVGGDAGETCSTITYPVPHPPADTSHHSCVCKISYPDNSNLPRSAEVFNESEVLIAADPGPSSCGTIGSDIKVWYNDEHALTLGVRQVVVKTSTGTTTTNYAIDSTPVVPTCGSFPLVGDTISNGAQAGNDVAAGGGRPLWPALFITDITADSTSRAGDWQQGGTGIPPHKVCGTWKGAVRTVDLTKNPAVVTVTPDPDPAKNGWSGIMDTPPGGFANYKDEGYGAECVWNVNNLPLQPKHTYRLQFMVHDGDQNKTGGDCGEVCTTVYMPSPRIENPQTVTSGGITATAYPNPFFSSTTIKFQRTDKAARAVVEVFSLQGVRVAKIFDGEIESDVTYKAEFHADDLAKGLYIYRIASDKEIITGKLIILQQ